MTSDRAGQAGSAADIEVPPLGPGLASGKRFGDLTRLDVESLSRLANSLGRRADVVTVLWQDGGDGERWNRLPSAGSSASSTVPTMWKTSSVSALTSRGTSSQVCGVALRHRDPGLRWARRHAPPAPSASSPPISGTQGPQWTRRSCRWCLFTGTPVSSGAGCAVTIVSAPRSVRPWEWLTSQHVHVNLRAIERP